MAGAAGALAPGMSGDLRSIRSWLDSWIAHGVSPYARPELFADWPPYVLIPLSPLFIVPAPLLPAVWLIVNVAASVAACRYLARTFTATSEEARVAFWMLLSLGAVRSGLWHGQLTMAAIVAGGWAMQHRASLGAGLLLALSMVKPHASLPFAAALAIRRRVMPLFVCAIALAASWAAYAATVHESIPASLTTYLGALQIHTGPNFWRSSSGLRTLAWRVLPWPASEIMAAVVSGGGAILITVLLWRARGRRDLDARALALLALWSLLTFHQQRYNMILAAPAFLILGLHMRTAARGLQFVHWLLVLEAGWLVGRVLPALDARLEILFAVVSLPALLVLALFGWLARDTWAPRARALELSNS